MLTNVTDSGGYQLALDYAQAGKALAVADVYLIDGQGDADPLLKRSFDVYGNVTSTADRNGVPTNLEYDYLNRLTNRWTAARGNTTYKFNPVGNLTNIVYTDSGSVVFQYDGLNRLTNMNDSLGATAFTWTPDDQLAGETGPFPNDAVSYTYNNRLRSGLGLQQPSGSWNQSYAYDPFLRLTNVTSFAGSFGYQYVSQDAYGDATPVSNRWNGATLLEAYAYDSAGELTNRSDTSGAYGWVFDQRGRVTTNSTPAGTLFYRYDANGNVTNVTSSTANGTLVTYQYDALNRLTNAIDGRLNGTQNTGYRFDAVGNLQAILYPSGVTNLYQYDALNRLTNLTWKLNTSTLASFYYQLGSTGNRTNLNETVSTATNSYTWQYDSLYRLTNEVVSGTAPTGNLGYGYDGVGNRTSRSGSLGTLGAQNFTYGTNDWISTDVYDNNGNTRTNANNQPYFYDYNNRLTNFNNGQVIIFYDADGNRVKEVTSTATNLYLVDTRNPSGYAQVLEELTVSGGTTNLVTAYAYGLDLISQRRLGVGTNFYGYDGHGSVRFLLNPAGTITDTYMFDAYGTLVNSTGSGTVNNYLYTGEQFDPDLGFYYLRARYMNPGTGRFWTMDTYEGDQTDPQSLHKYLYAADDPVDNDDPSGHDFELGGMLAVMDIFSGFFAQISPATSTAVTGGIALEAAPKDHDSRLLTAAMFAETSTAHYGGENQDEKEAICVTVMNQAFYAKLPPGSKQKYNYNKSFGDGTILSAIQHGCVSYMGSRWDKVANASDLLSQAQLEANLKLDERKHFNLSVDIANLLFGYHAPLTIKPLNNEAPIGFHSGKQIASYQIQTANISSANSVGMSFTASTKVMNINKTFNLLVLVLVLSACHAVCAPQEADAAPQISGERMARLESNIAHAIIWHLYWHEGKTEAQIRKQAIESRPMPYTVRRGENDDLSVYLAGYQWKIDLTPIGSDYYGFYVEDFKALARNDATEAKRSYLEALNRETEITNGVLTLRPEHLSVLAFDKPGDQRYQLIVNVVMTNLLDSRWLKKDMAANKVHGPLTVHVGGFSGQSPWIYYHVEGMPYVGMMLIDPSSGEFIHDDLQYIGDNPRESEYEVMRRKIDKSNIKLSLHPPTQTAKAESP